MIKTFFPSKDFAALLFDFDGTIADTMPPHFDAWVKVLSNYGIPFTKKQHLDWAGRPTHEIVQMLGNLHGKTLSFDKIAKAKENHYLGAISNVKEIKPVMEIIRESYGKVPMAVVSGGRHRTVEYTINHLSLAKYFDAIVCAEDYVNGKPAPDCFLKAATLLKVKPEDCLVFEDADLGVRAAQSAGMECLRVIEVPLGHQLTLVPRPL